MRQAVWREASAWVGGRGARTAALTALACLGFGHMAAAKPITSTKITHYSVSASTANGLDQQMSSLGPWHGRERAYANIVVRPSYDGRLVQGKVCKLQNFKVVATFTMTLPKLASGLKLSKTLQGQWKSFASFARRHEETHRSIWLDCLTKAERRALALRVTACDALGREVDRVFASEWSRCEKRQEAFDIAERTKLAQHPLIVAATRVQRSTSAVKVASSANSRSFTRSRRD